MTLTKRPLLLNLEIKWFKLKLAIWNHVESVCSSWQNKANIMLMRHWQSCHGTACQTVCSYSLQPRGLGFKPSWAIRCMPHSGVFHIALLLTLLTTLISYQLLGYIWGLPFCVGLVINHWFWHKFILTVGKREKRDAHWKRFSGVNLVIHELLGFFFSLGTVTFKIQFLHVYTFSLLKGCCLLQAISKLCKLPKRLFLDSVFLDWVQWLRSNTKQQFWLKSLTRCFLCSFFCIKQWMGD